MLPLIRAIQARTAAVAISPSTVRGQGGEGVVGAARDFLAALDLRRFGVSDKEAFRNELKAATKELMAVLPEKARSWGIARKCLNIFLRDAFYTCYLRDEYGLALAEDFYEIPLDGVVVKELKKRAGRGKLPRWDTVKRLKWEDSLAYQKYARELAQGMKITRVHLDTYLWVNGRKTPKPGAVEDVSESSANETRRGAGRSSGR